ncbi:MAG: glutathione S-transferase family protein [Gammaproteobacteria bacterium]|nr:glutathione S-transferase family protein [Gammaproteobacteria bacterium]MDP2347141.1 glutathione S-transferase family protein [Gammaproteobacteria bacterium]
MEPILFYGVPQGCSFGSIVALEWLGQPYRLCRIEMQKHPWHPLYERINPLRQTPSMLLEDDRVLGESLAILLHIAGRDLDKPIGFAQGTVEFDQLNQMLAYLHTDFFSAFNPLWIACEFKMLDEESRATLRAIGEDGAARNFSYLNNLLANRQWLLGGKSPSVADAYFVGVARWADYHKLFDMEREYPHLHRHLQKLQTDPAVMFAEKMERGEAVATNRVFRGHVTLDEMEERLLPNAVAERSQGQKVLAL